MLETAPTNNIARVASALHPRAGRFAFASKHLTARGPKTFRITLNPSRRGRELVGNHVRPILLRLWVRYIPAGGSARTIRRLGLHIPGT